MSLADVARLADGADDFVSRAAVQQVELGAMRPSRPVLEHIASRLGRKAEDFVVPEGEVVPEVLPVTIRMGFRRLGPTGTLQVGVESTEGVRVLPILSISAAEWAAISTCRSSRFCQVVCMEVDP